MTEWRVDAYAGRKWEPVGWWPSDAAAETFIRDLACLPCRIEKEGGGMKVLAILAAAREAVQTARKALGALTDALNKGRARGWWSKRY